MNTPLNSFCRLAQAVPSPSCCNRWPKLAWMASRASLARRRATLVLPRRANWPARSSTTWGGIPQDALLPGFDETQFEAVVAQAATMPTMTTARSSASPTGCQWTADIERLKAVVAPIEQVS